MPELSSDCKTCYGTGEIVSDRGPVSCPDCYGDGRSAQGNKMEWRLRDLERSYRTGRNESLGDIMWLIHELRQTRQALIHILTRCQDAADSDETARYVRTQAMAALGLLGSREGA